MGDEFHSGSTSLRGVQRTWLIALGLAAGLIWWRDQRLLSNPRFFAEEGSHYFAFARQESLFATLGAPLVDYFDILCVLGAEFATLFPLEHAPLATTLVGGIVQLLPVFLLLTLPIHGLSGWRGLVAGLFCLVAPHSSDLWLTTTGAYWHVALAAFLLALEQPTRVSGRRGATWRLILLFMAGLCGPSSFILFPVFALMACKERRRVRVLQCAVLASCMAFQGWFLLRTYGTSEAGGELASSRYGAEGPLTLAVVIVTRSCGTLFLGPNWAAALGAKLQELALSNSHGFVVLAGVTVVIGIVALVLLIRGPVAFTCVLAAASCACAGAIAGLGPKLEYLEFRFGGRYFYAANVLLFWGMLASMGTSRWKLNARSLIVSLFLMSLLSQSLWQYRSTMTDHRAWSDWRNEVRQARASGLGLLRIWPENWFVWLNGRTVPAELHCFGKSQPAGRPNDFVLYSDVPCAGRKVVFGVRGGPPRQMGSIFISLERLRDAVSLPGFVDLQSILPLDERTRVFRTFVTDDEGSYTDHLSIIDANNLWGLRAYFQAAVLGADPCVSNALEIVVGYD